MIQTYTRSHPPFKKSAALASAGARATNVLRSLQQRSATLTTDQLRATSTYLESRAFTQQATRALILDEHQAESSRDGIRRGRSPSRNSTLRCIRALVSYQVPGQGKWLQVQVQVPSSSIISAHLATATDDVGCTPRPVNIPIDQQQNSYENCASEHEARGQAGHETRRETG